MQLERILVALKPWQRELPLATEHALALARGGAQIRLLTAVFDVAVAVAHERGDPAALASEGRAIFAARVELDRLAALLRRGDTVVTTRTVWGAPAYAEIVGATRDWPADLLVIGAHDAQSGHGRLTDTDWQLTRLAACPLLLIKTPVFSGYDTIVAVAEADGAAGVATAGHCFARAFGASLRILAGTERRELGRAAERRASLVVLGAPPEQSASEALVGGAACDVLLVPEAVIARAASAERLQVG
jgi:nucleotide-binding universal stress UspA family protein